MSEEEINIYYNRWDMLGEIYEGGDYIKLFKQSSALITDSISFLGEYLPSGNPVFQFINNIKIFNDFGKNIISSYYQIKNIQDLEKIFNRVLFYDDDFLKKDRISKIDYIFNKYEPVSKRIIKIIENSLIT